MANYPIPETPEYNVTMRQIEANDDVEATFVNGYILGLLKNDDYLKKKTDSLEVQKAELDHITQQTNVTASGYMVDARQMNPNIAGTMAARMDAVENSDRGKAVTNHASAETTYGLGGGSNYGHVKLSGAVDSTSDTGGGIAATPNAVKKVYDKAVLGEKIWTVVLPAISWTGTAAPFSITVTVAGMTADYSPVWSALNNGATEAEFKRIAKEGGYIQAVTTAAGEITVMALKKPSGEITLLGKGV